MILRRRDPVINHKLTDIFVICIYFLQYGDDDYDVGDDDYDEYQYRKSKDRGRGEFKTVRHTVNTTFSRC